jgi:hypothetical protein
MAEQIDYQVVLQEVLAKARQAAENASVNDDYNRGLRMAYYLDFGHFFGSIQG